MLEWLHNAFRWSFDNGVPGNEVANLLWIPVSAFTAGIVGWLRVHHHLKRHERKIDKLHAHLGIEYDDKEEKKNARLTRLHK